MTEFHSKINKKTGKDEKKKATREYDFQTRIKKNISVGILKLNATGILQVMADKLREDKCIFSHYYIIIHTDKLGELFFHIP